MQSRLPQAFGRQQQHLSAQISKGPQPLERFLQGDLITLACCQCRSRIGARHDHQIRPLVAVINGCLNSVDRRIAIDNGFHAGVAAAFGSHLIFEHDSGKASLGELLHCALRIGGIAVAGLLHQLCR